MRTLILLGLFLSFLIPNSLIAQRVSTNGYVHSPKGHLHMLVIFIRYENKDLMPGQKAWPNNSRKEGMPTFAKGENNELFSADTSYFGKAEMKHNLSEYYYLNSGKEFLVTADIYPIQVPIKYINPRRGNYYGNYVKMNQAAINWITQNDPDFDWSKYDNRKNYPKYTSDNSLSEPDGILDYVIINHRAPGSNGFGSTGNLQVPGTKYRINAGHTAATCYADAKHNWMYNTHEFAHNLFQCPHVMGANTSDGNKYYVQKGWGMMAAWHAPFYTTNAWESWWLGWLKPQEIEKNGKYIIRDFLTERDAIRIAIPGSKDYLWIENHQKKHYWDGKIFYNDSSKAEPGVAKGLYMYVVSDEANRRENPQLGPFKKSVVNFIKLYNAEGNFDYTYTDEKESYWNVFLKGKPNPFAGQNDFQFIKTDLDKNNKICVPFIHGNNDGKSCDQIDIWAEKIEGKNTLTYGNTGNDDDALVEGDEVGLSGIFPVTNFPVFNKYKDSLDAYIVNGISIKILERLEDGSYTLDVNFDDWKIRKDQRWCGTLQMEEQHDSSIIEYLEVLPGNTLSLELSGTPNRQNQHPLTGSCAAPTKLVVPEGRGIFIDRKAKLYVDSTSSIVFKKGSYLKLKRGAILDVKGKLVFEDEESIQSSIRRLRSKVDEDKIIYK
ncbi:MAG: hypothetical protein MRZ79_14260 [Bacteroidia bacterium]|nr:hypothetical protein [Bacteroidia bacterium]